jgi:hypothetical protein
MSFGVIYFLYPNFYVIILGGKFGVIFWWKFWRDFLNFIFEARGGARGVGEARLVVVAV